jgi:hypothetical protein
MVLTIFPLAVFAEEPDECRENEIKTTGDWMSKNELRNEYELFVSKDNAPVREGPSGNDKILLRVSQSERLDICGYLKAKDGKRWYHVTAYGKKETVKGWIFSDNVMLLESVSVRYYDGFTKKQTVVRTMPVSKGYGKDVKTLPVGTVVDWGYGIKNLDGEIWLEIDDGFIKSDSLNYMESVIIEADKGFVTNKETVTLRSLPVSKDFGKETRKMTAGEDITILCAYKNHLGNLWYETAEGDYIYSENVLLVPYFSPVNNNEILNGLGELSSLLNTSSAYYSDISSFVNADSMIDYVVGKAKGKATGSISEYIHTNHSDSEKTINMLWTAVTGDLAGAINIATNEINGLITSLKELDAAFKSVQESKTTRGLLWYAEDLSLLNEKIVEIEKEAFYDGLKGTKKSNSQIKALETEYNNAVTKYSKELYSLKTIDDWHLSDWTHASIKEKSDKFTDGLGKLITVIPRPNIKETYNNFYSLGQSAAKEIDTRLQGSDTVVPPPTWSAGTGSGSSAGTGSSGIGSGSTGTTSTVPPATSSTTPPTAPPPKWSDWSGWSEQYVASSATRQVETMVRYRYHYYSCPGCGYHSSWYGINCWNCGTHITNNWREKWLSKGELAAVLVRYDQGDDSSKGVAVLTGEDWWFYEYSGQPSKTYYRSRTLS